MVFYQKDWFMRQIEGMSRALGQVLFDKGDLFYEVADEQRQTPTDLLFAKLCALLEREQINQAENLLFEHMEPENLQYAALALDFYRRINALDDETLARANFSRAEIREGLADVAAAFRLTLCDIP